MERRGRRLGLINLKALLYTLHFELPGELLDVGKLQIHELTGKYRHAAVKLCAQLWCLQSVPVTV